MLVMQIITKGESGGAQTHVLTLCRALAEEVQLCVVIGTDAQASPLERQLEPLQIPTTRLPALTNSLSPWRAWHAVRALTRLVREQRPDILHAHSTVAGAVARIVGWWTGTPVIYTVHGFGFKPEVPLLRRCLAGMVEWLLARWTAHLICVSEHERQLAQRLPLAARHISVIHNSLGDTDERAHPALEPMRCIMVARFAPPKRHDLLLQALALVRQELGHEIPTRFLGNGPTLPASQTLARTLGLRRIEWAGDVADVPHQLAQHAVLVLMSDHEGLPISVLEAMRAGLAIVANDLPGLRELIEPGHSGLLVPATPQALAQALLTLAHTPTQRRSLGQAARARFEQAFNTPAAMRQLRALYGQIAPHASS